MKCAEKSVPLHTKRKFVQYLLLKTQYDFHNKHIKRSLIKSYSKDKDEYYDSYTNSMKSNIINLLIWCDYEKLITYFNYNGINLTYPSFTTSTYLILDYLEKQKYLSK